MVRKEKNGCVALIVAAGVVVSVYLKFSRWLPSTSFTNVKIVQRRNNF